MKEQSICEIEKKETKNKDEREKIIEKRSKVGGKEKQDSRTDMRKGMRTRNKK